MGLFNNLLSWTTDTFAPLGSTGLFVLAFIESSFFPIPPDVLLILLSLESPQFAFWFALVCTAGSVLGGIIGYYIGVIGKIAVLERMFSQEKIARVHDYFHNYDALAIFIAGFTPIPYKVFTIASGVFGINLNRFVIASLFGRGLRFFTLATLIMYFGKTITSFIDQYLGLLSLALAFVLIIVWIVLINR